ncbi:hypothetical protein LCGC14_0018750 [marine sediment metagenome]|uniref:DinB-like domain-containing protein n=1 Tax=marine sediment metagenome TaxID=412755 RepID=A0A0F9Z2Q8_9ZZZZ|nr:hypothetical protein [Phycisphaerae bacterium]HDZ44913.1 hypothetical protein [Phycisphaerae bacterium]
MNDGDREIIDHFSWVREQTLELLRRLPDKLLSQTSAGCDETLGDALTHAGCGEDWWMANVLGDGGPAHHPYPGDRQALIDQIASCRDRVVGFFSADNGGPMGRTFSFTADDGRVEQWTGRDRLMYFIDHEVHHHARITQALRQLGFDDFPWPGCEA